ncbi:MAG TPA: DivIVA domain-containing protein [Candidatus Methylomirabilis sp.]|nr:DivIVA domain-containing protein [Candidatus Methylomirabilis sp.]
MRITPMDIRQQQFTVRMFRGFDVQEVDTFLEDLAGDYETLLKENALLKEQLQSLEERTRGLENRERVLQETLVSTQKIVEEMKEGARREASLVLREAELRGETLVEAARGQEAALQAEITMLRRMRRQLVESFRASLDMYQRMLDRDLKVDPADEPAGQP